MELINPLICKIVNSVQVNLFLGFGTCHAFPFVNGELSCINIAIEKLIVKEDIDNSLCDLISHEIAHIIRIRLGLFNSGTLGEMLVEEGLACYFNKYIMDINTEDYQRLFPINLNLITNIKAETTYNNFISNLNKSNSKLISE